MLAPLLASSLLASSLVTSSPLAAPPLGPLPRVATGLARSVGATAPPVAGARAGSWLPPVGALPVAVVHPFLAPPGPYAAGHRGVDLAASAAAPVRAPAPGRVLFAGQVAGRPLVVLLHPGGVRTTYEPVAPSVAVGDQVAAGQMIGTLAPAASHCLPSACLHWGARVGSGDAARYVDPLALLAGQGPVRLLPLDGHRG